MSRKMKVISDFYQLFTDCVMHFPCSAVRLLYAKLVFKNIGSNCYLGRHIHIVCPHKISLSNNVVVNRFSTLDGREGLEISDNVDIGEFSSIWTLQHIPDDPYHSTKGGKTIIKDHVWIAPHSILLPGIIIKRGCVIATSSVVTHSTDEKQILAGVPAKVIRQRKNQLMYQLEFNSFF